MSDKTHPHDQNHRRRFAPLMWIGGLGAVAILTLGVNSSLSAWTASITNTDNEVATGSLAMLETGPGTTSCRSDDATAECSTINKYGDAGVTATLAPGDVVTTTVNISNVGTSDADSFTLVFEACTQTPAAALVGPPVVGDLCAQLNIDVYQGSDTTGTLVASGTPTALFNGSFITLTALDATTAGGLGQDYTFVVTLPETADNTYQGILATQAMTWTFTV